jgi:exopolysaccharide production protein ExoF
MTFNYADLSRVGFFVLALGWGNAFGEDIAGIPGGLSQKADRAAPATSESAVPSAVTDAQKVSLKFSDIPKLNGDYRVNADQTVTIPGLGRVAVGGITIPEFEGILSDRATGIAGRDVYVTVEVSEYRPIFITGSVPRVGPLPWQPELTVEQAVAAVGGVARLQATESLLQRRRAELEEQRLVAAMARLQAEQQGADRIVSPELVKLSGKNEAEKLIGAQFSLMRNRQTAMQKQLDAIAVGKTLANEELDALRLQRSKLDNQLQLRRKQRERIQALLEQKLTVADRALEEDIKVSDLEEKSANISVAMARVQATITNFDREALSVAEARKSEIDNEIIRLERELAQTRAVLNVLKSSDQEQEPSIRYSISRRGNLIEAGPSSLLMPGDLLAVAQEVSPQQ